MALHFHDFINENQGNGKESLKGYEVVQLSAGILSQNSKAE